MTRSFAGTSPLLLLLIAAWIQPGKDQSAEVGDSMEPDGDGLIRIEMVQVPAGSFMMGSTNADDEDPVHEVRLGAFFIGKYEVTQRQWREVMGTNPSGFTGDDRPVENVTWEDAQGFAAQLSETTGEIYRLPTEAEWEYAARAGSTTDFHLLVRLTVEASPSRDGLQAR